MNDVNTQRAIERQRIEETYPLSDATFGTLHTLQILTATWYALIEKAFSDQERQYAEMVAGVYSDYKDIYWEAIAR